MPGISRDFSHQLDDGRMIDAKQLADLRMHTRLTAAFGFDVRLGASHMIHVGGRATDVADDPLEIFVFGHRLDFVRTDSLERD